MTPLAGRFAIRGGGGRRYRLKPVGLVLAPLVAIALQVKVPLFSEYLSFLESPLLVTVYFGLMTRAPVPALLIGAAVGLAQDALSQNPLGLFGIVKTLVGYWTASVSLRLDADNTVVRLGFAAVFYVVHQALYWSLASSLLGQQFNFGVAETLLFAAMNGLVAVPLFQLMDRLREPARL
jgi:rod shape-determining protein MreD